MSLYFAALYLGNTGPQSLASSSSSASGGVVLLVNGMQPLSVVDIQLPPPPQPPTPFPSTPSGSPVKSPATASPVCAAVDWDEVSVVFPLIRVLEKKIYLVPLMK